MRTFICDHRSPGLLGRRQERVERHATPRRDNSRIMKQRRPTGKLQKVLNYVI